MRDDELQDFPPAKVVSVGEHELAVVEVGRGPTVLFSHGTPTWSYEWRHLIARLSQRHRCVAVDHLGFGRSARPVDGDYRPEAHAKRFSQLVETLGLERFTLVVHDMGGPFALDLAVEQPSRVERLVVFNSFMWALDRDPAMQRVARLAGTWAFKQLYRHLNFSLRVLLRTSWKTPGTLTDAVYDAYASRFTTADDRERVLWALAKSMTASSAYYDSLWQRRERLRATPTDVVWGMADPAFTPAALAKWREALPHARVHELAGRGHWPHEEAPEECVAALGEAFAGAAA